MEIATVTIESTGANDMMGDKGPASYAEKLAAAEKITRNMAVWLTGHTGHIVDYDELPTNTDPEFQDGRFSYDSDGFVLTSDEDIDAGLVDVAYSEVCGW